MMYSKKRGKVNLTQPSLEKLLEIVPSKYDLVLLASKRARQIKREIEFRVDTHRENEYAKPLTTALFEIVEGRITAEDLKYVDLFEDTHKDVRAPVAVKKDSTKQFFEEETVKIEPESIETELGFDELEEPHDLKAVLSEE